MSKSVLVIDTPKNCMYCPLCFYTEMYNEHQCNGTECTNSYSRTITEYGEGADRPDWCPLSPLPPRKDLPSCMQRGDTKSMTHLIEDIIGAGYNKCLDDLQKGVANEG